MSEVKPPVQYASAPVAAPSGSQEHYVQHTPVWIVVTRGAQVFFSLIILGMAGAVIHDVMIEELAFGIACVVFTWIVIGYVLITEKVSGAREAYNIWAVLSLDFLMAVLWLAALGSIAARRARFVVPVSTANCRDDGSAVSSKTCDVYPVKRALEKRAAVLTQTGLGLTSGAAGLSALMWLLFIATLVYHGHTFRLWHQANKKPADAELNAQGAPMLATQQQAAPAPGPVYNSQQQYQPQTQFPQQYPPQQQQQQQQQQQPQQQPQQQQQYTAQPSQQYQQPQAPFQPSPVGTPSPYQQQYQTPQPTGTPQPYAYPQQQQQQQQPHPYPQAAEAPGHSFPQAAEAPGHSYYPPQQ
uniref:MARVEL domain-containing protein n=2 Tax=Podospora anserina (strain S / ATCC MYA-4624 / DSM 980 / FGSC 10383) TaxID=515849 RepID=A0A090D757_PODAN|nr:Putative protein of unknown function [Podospora anserina S mat+]